MTSSAPDTFPKLLLEHARLRPNHLANREKDYGIWHSWTWAQVAAEVEALAWVFPQWGLSTATSSRSAALRSSTRNAKQATSTTRASSVTSGSRTRGRPAPASSTAVDRHHL